MPDAFDGVDIAIGSTPDEVARDFAPWAVERGAVVVDESGYWRMNADVPLVIPEVNPHAVRNHKGIIASPNCSTTQMVVALKPLHDWVRHYERSWSERFGELDVVLDELRQPE